MGFIELILLSVGLAMDAFAVSLSDGLDMKKFRFGKALLIAFMFGLFQAGMPLLGYLLGSTFASLIAAWDHIIALVLLGFIGGKMILDGIKESLAVELDNPVKSEREMSFLELLLQAIATSIDALVVGVGFAAMSVSIAPAVTCIGVITLVISLAGVIIGKKFGDMLGSKAEIIGGLILVGIGAKIFIEHVFFA